MASSYSTLLRFELIANGEQSGSWGTTTNTNLGTLVEQAIAGVTSVTLNAGASSPYTLTTSNGASDQARSMILYVSGTLATSVTVVVPNSNKAYFVHNNTSSGTLVISSGTGGTVTVSAGKKRFMFVRSGGGVFDLSALSALSDDTTPTLGGNLNVSTFSIGAGGSTPVAFTDEVKAGVGIQTVSSSSKWIDFYTSTNKRWEIKDNSGDLSFNSWSNSAVLNSNPLVYFVRGTANNSTSEYVFIGKSAFTDTYKLNVGGSVGFGTSASAKAYIGHDGTNFVYETLSGAGSHVFKYNSLQLASVGSTGELQLSTAASSQAATILVYAAGSATKAIKVRSNTAATNSENALVFQSNASADVGTFGVDSSGQAYVKNNTSGVTLTFKSTTIETASDMKAASFQATSAAKYKENVAPLATRSEKFMRLRPVTYNRIGHENKEIGLIADDVVKLYPEIVGTEAGKPESIDYSRLTVILVREVQRLSRELAELRKKV